MATSTKFIAVFTLLLCCSLVSARPGSRCRGFHTAFAFPSFDSNVEKLTLLGDAKIVDSGLMLAGSEASSAGGIFYSEPVRLMSRFHPGLSKSFSTFFSFSMDASKGDGLAFVIAPSKSLNGKNGPWLGLSDKSSDLGHTVAVEFDASPDPEVHDPSGNHVGFDLESLVSLATAEVSDGFSLKEGEKLYAWIDYIAPAHILEVRLSRSGTERPAKPVLAYSVDLADVWQEEMFVGFSSSTGDNPQRHILYSWSFVTRGMGMWGQRFHPGGFGPHEEHGFWRHGPREEHDFWRHGPHEEHGFWHHGPGDWHHRPHGPRDFHHGHEGFPYLPGHDGHHGEWHGDRRPLPESDNDAWFDGLSDVWGVIFSLLLGALCGMAATGFVLLVWCAVRKLYKRNNDKVSGFVFGYQKLPPAEMMDSDVKANSGAYQKLATTDPDTKAESV